ncbi:Na/Pi cotransporter family protein [Shewanella gelidii]|uniref:Na/Pi cotransporter n=1 Tax=Shewanella gelidii TaxID=1642821 RepID=A0A917JM16_9GAMM|nr:Na/Pi cotransporter family protein [Shewanella gelidii]MCL1097073.1 Na/Pi cotransporter family protein [Shewanella gelidii]GGI72383.1 Na/Pi cotransporter [Shewanella gelidii]
MFVKFNPQQLQKFIAICFLFMLSFWSTSSYAADSGKDFDTLPMLVGLFGGLALFLYGMEKMSQALKLAAGERMRTLLSKLTSNRFVGMLTGTGLTAVIQSSSVTTVLLVGFISAGLMSMPQAVGVIMGANIGTTVTAQIIAFKVTKAALAMVAVGFAVQFISSKEKIKQYGDMLMGLGLIFLGMNIMGEAMSPLREYQPFIDAMTHMDNALLAILISAGFTALVQSSSATTGIVIVLAAQGFISLETGIALAMGANIGTCITAMLSALGKPREAVQAAVVHVCFNVLGVVIWLPFIAYLGEFSTQISPVHTELTGVAKQSAEIPRQIANANTLFNVLNTLIMLPFAGVFVWFVERVVPVRAKPSKAKQQVIKPKYLSEELLSTPELALDQAQLELSRVGRRVCNMMNLLPPIASHDAADKVRKQLKQIETIEEEVDTLHANILSYLGRLRLEPLSDSQSQRQIKLVSITDQLESIADLVVDSLLPLAYRALNTNLTISPKMRNTLDTAQERVNQALLDCVNAVRREDAALAEQVLHAKRELNSLLETVLTHQAERLSEGDELRLKLFRVEMEWVDSLKRIYTLSKRIAKLQLRKREPK